MRPITAARPLRYHLRFQIIPGKNVVRDARILARFCRAHGIEEVVLFFAAEEWNNGLLSKPAEDRWFDALRRIKPILDKAGIGVSLNPWMTVLHCDRGRRFPPDRTFQPMVSPRGEASRACASFADPAWRGYVFGLYGRFAALGFRVLWVEDDFRYHNHAPLTWGGGFEPAILKRFAKKVGRSVSRKAVVANVLRPGTPHPWRALWMETWREVQLEVAAGLADAVAKNTPSGGQLGLMSSLPATHSVEGRCWRSLFANLSIGGRVAHRPHFAGYTEGLGRGHSYSILMLDAQRDFRPAGCEVAPEVENFPFTRWAKSDSQTWAQMAVCLFFGSDALLLDLFPFSANPADREPAIGAMLDRSRLALEWIAARFPKALQTQGVGLPWREDAQAHVRTTVGEAFTELDANAMGPGHFLLSYGVPVSARRQAVNALFGSLAWAFPDEEIREMLSGGLLLDAASAEILCRRGFGPEIGLRFRQWVGREESTYAIERVTHRDAGAPLGHCFNHNLPDRMALLAPLRGAREWTTVITPESKRVGPATLAFRNRRGGRVFTYAVPNPAQLPRDDYRQRIAQKAVAFAAGGRFASPMVSGGPYLMPIHFTAAGRDLLVLFNGGTDPCTPVVQMPHGSPAPARATLLAPLAGPAACRIPARGTAGRNRVTVSGALPYQGYLVLE